MIQSPLDHWATTAQSAGPQDRTRENVVIAVGLFDQKVVNITRDEAVSLSAEIAFVQRVADDLLEVRIIAFDAICRAC